VRPVVLHDPTYFIVENVDLVEIFDLPADPFEVLGTESAAA
jgi:hypothetical protein